MRQSATEPRLVVLRRYLVFVLPVNLAWETLQLPLFTLWEEGDAGMLARAVLHCTGGDLLIASGSLLLGTVLALERFLRVAATSTALGVSYTVWSEWLNTSVKGAWAYSQWMPIVPVLGVGISPIAQWIVIPLLGFGWARRGLASPKTDPPGQIMNNRR